MAALADLLRWAICLIGNAVGLPLVLLIAVFSRQGGYRAMRAVCAFGHRVLGVDVTLEDRNGGRYPAQAYVFVQLNQNSLIETFLLPWLAPCPHKVIMNIEMALVPIFGWAQTLLGSRVLVRQWPRQAKRQLARAVEELRRGETYCISIEGRRSPDGGLQPYKKGAVLLAMEAQVPIVPFVLIGARDRLPPGTWRIRPGAVHVVLLEAVSTQGLGYDDRDVLIARLRTLAEQELERYTAPA